MKGKIQISILSIKLLVSAVLFGLAMCVINSFISYREFKRQVESMYSKVTSQFAETAISYIDADRIFIWLTEGPDKYWDSMNARLNELTETAQLAYIYLTVVSADYKSRTYVFDTVNSLVLNDPFPLGYVESLERKTPDYIEDLQRIFDEGASQSYFSYKKNGGHVTTSIPVRDFTGTVIAVMSVVKPMNEIAEYKANYLRVLLFAALGFTAFFLVLYTFSLIRGLVQPLMFIIDETSHFAEHHGELTGLLKKIKNHDELGLLAKSVEKMSIDMNQYISELTSATAEKERLGAELNVATKIQAEMLPRVFPPYENHPEIELFASMTPAKEVGGDFYDFFMIDDRHFALTVADVSGKGVPAALFMVIAKTLLKDASFRYSLPSEIFTHVNDILCEGNESGMFVTCWLGILDVNTGKLVFANAGHTSPVLCKNGSVSYLESKPNLMLAAMPDMVYMDHEIVISKGDRLFLYTDGVTEAADKNENLYGEERLLNKMKNLKSENPRDVLDEVRSDIDAFVQGAPQFDDLTMLAMIYKGK
ncbi:SpoIIE family protein phosphatase [Treponema sp. UBA3813]|uniref:SpoIIE family protein phosphatase n=1 Tax=Treponema sp. UBA3813 TaxID=1947715 RepID=UPI0025FB9F72|nr:PP2C family protein-serine/threonine phosphatase [Treponema sp. UBA3813]